MGQTIIQKIFENHTESTVHVNDIIDIAIDVRIARDFGGANVVKNLEENNLTIKDPQKTFFTFDCNPGGCDQKYAANQQKCRIFARKNRMKVYDINQGIGTHISIDEGLIQPGGTLVSTDSHANIVGAIGAFGQGMGDIDIAAAFSKGTTWFKVPETIKIILKGMPSKQATAKDVVLKLTQTLGAHGLLGYAAEIYGKYVDSLSLDSRITIASMATEMGAIILLFPPNQKIIHFFSQFSKKVEPVYADNDAPYGKTIEIDIENLEPQIARPGHPEDVVEVEKVKGTTIDSGFIGSCTNGRLEDMKKVAEILNNKKIAPGRVLKIVPATDRIWKECLQQGIIKIFKDAGALVGSAGCAGCAAGQIGQTGPGEIAVSSGNRNFTGKQGKGEIYLASPETVAASLIAGYITTSIDIPKHPIPVQSSPSSQQHSINTRKEKPPPLALKGQAWVIKKDNIDTDMIYHNRYLSITNIEDMGKYTFDNLAGHEDFATKAKKGDIVVVGKNFGCGSSRQQAVDCFKSLGIAGIIAESFGAIYERNAINSAFSIMTLPDSTNQIENNDVISLNLKTGEIINETQGKKYQTSLSKVQLTIYQRGGLLQR